MNLAKILENETIKNNLFDKNPRLYLNVMDKLGKSEEVEKKLNMLIKNALNKGPKELFEVGKSFYRMGREDEFKDRLSENKYTDRILHDLERYRFHR